MYASAVRAPASPAATSRILRELVDGRPRLKGRSAFIPNCQHEEPPWDASPINRLENDFVVILPEQRQQLTRSVCLHQEAGGEVVGLAVHGFSILSVEAFVFGLDANERPLEHFVHGRWSFQDACVAGPLGHGFQNQRVHRSLRPPLAHRLVSASKGYASTRITGRVFRLGTRAAQSNSHGCITHVLRPDVTVTSHVRSVGAGEVIKPEESLRSRRLIAASFGHPFIKGDADKLCQFLSYRGGSLTHWPRPTSQQASARAHCPGTRRPRP